MMMSVSVWPQQTEFMISNVSGPAGNFIQTGQKCFIEQNPLLRMSEYDGSF